MAPDLKDLGIDKLSVEDRIDLAVAIWDSIADDSPLPELTDTQRLELDRRIAEDDANPNDTIPWETVRDEALARLGSPTTDR